MSPYVFLLVFLTGAAVVGLWCAQRFPRRAPSSPLGVAAHLVAANVAASLAPTLMLRASPQLGAVPALMLIVLPPLVYFFLACAWLLLLLQRLVGSYR